MSVITQAGIRAAVDLGWEFMERHNPGWWREDAQQPVNLLELDLADPRHCVLGQTCPLEVLACYVPRAYERAYPYFAYRAVLSGCCSEPERHYWAAQHGFAFPAGYSQDEDGTDEWAQLTGEWLKRIKDAREALAASAVLVGGGTA